MTSRPSWNVDLAAFVEKAFTPEVNTALGGMDVGPSLNSAGNGFRLARGVARATHNLGDGRVFTPTSQRAPENVVELQVHEDGGLRVFFGRLSALWTESQPHEQMIIESAAVVYTRRLLALVLAAGDESGLQGMRAAPNRDYFFTGNRYNQDTYTATTAATWAELNQASGAITRRLTGALLRTLGTEAAYMGIFSDPQSDTDATTT
ncbi:hypothetical protein E1293_40865 [Actinomadura darangshiensis]|uniref:Uncharacterized protein n=1 Tax=Actinomadura darangshiensis TaxID=705336 RepID=A0A4R5A2F0_9ACTN|nr:hypothetical protein [Actinomadura darangshiensis]TDD64986.1 hypothetical protein E1293_40865 [Actinomadura darangshiensis]